MPLPRLTMPNYKLFKIAIGLALSTVILTGCNSEPESEIKADVVRPAMTEIVTFSNHSELSLSGTVQASQRADLSFRVSGRLVEILVKEGDEVKKGELLARLDPKDAESNLNAARVEMRNAQTEYQRAKSIFESSQAISKSQLEEIEVRFRLANHRLDEAKRRLEETRLLAPFDGMISRKHRNTHVLVQANEAVLSVHNLSDMEVVIDVPERLMLKDDQQQPTVMAQIPALSGKQFELALKTYSTKPDPVTQTYEVTMGFVDLKGTTVLPGMIVRVVPGEDNQAVSSSISVPLSAVIPDNQGHQYVWLVNSENQLEKRFIKTGTLKGNRVEVTANLEVGEQIVVAGTANLSESMTVRPTLMEAK
ncbi:efflux RND transporter periplasmic adaptor subunit [Photobacterium rosenbergii]|uniref:Efflux RND transporter periplasmic adaptor subunit n=1 Tax=Photobacterium rosenbergii TaxID=294936 RepID=A0ABU3ZI49_9GAMM|nr:efflux RND transporter periplasmic adaptor subunit [Photobacterium rosenbergii]MDV5169614.1 efflux RND transporter periplasmic adaptor subunit [Photobacterium rosenbergii]